VFFFSEGLLGTRSFCVTGLWVSSSVRFSVRNRTLRLTGFFDRLRNRTLRVTGFREPES
jgi:hypothetical protein